MTIAELSFEELAIVNGGITASDVETGAVFVASGAAIVAGAAVLTGDVPIAVGAGVVAGTATVVAVIAGAVAS